MPNRIIREGYLDSPRVALLDAMAERFYFRMFLVVDDQGRIENRPELLKSWCFPVREDIRSADVTRWIAACEKAGLILAYEVNGRRYIELQEFRQRTRTASKCPDPPGMSDARGQLRANDGLVVVVSEVESAVAVVAAVGKTADQRKQRKQPDEGAWSEVEKAIRTVLNSEDAKVIADYGRREWPDCPEAAQRRLVGWSIEARINCKDSCKAKYVLGCSKEPSDSALDEYKRVMAKFRGQL